MTKWFPLRLAESLRLVMLAAFLSSGCATTSTRQYRAAEEQIIRETVLSEYLASRNTDRVIFVAFRDSNFNFADPSDAVMARIKAAGISAQKLSQAGYEEHRNPIDKATGKPAIIYYSGVVRWFNNSKAKVIHGVDCGSLCGGFTEFTIEKKNGKWTRTKTNRAITI